MLKRTQSDLISISSTIISLIGFLLVIWEVNTANEQIRKTEINQRAQFLAELQERAFGSSDFQEIFIKLEYDKISMDEKFHGSKEQIQLVALLSFFEFVSQLEKMGLIEFQDIKDIFGYYILRVDQNKTVIAYRNFLQEWVKKGKYTDNVTFPKFKSLAERIKLAETSPGVMK